MSKNDFIVNGETPINPLHSVDGQIYEGLTKREYFAGLAMQGYLANGHPLEMIIRDSIDTADALLKELEK